MDQPLERFTLAGFPAMRCGNAGPGRPPLLFVHGAFANHFAFGRFMQRLASRGFHGVAASRRGRLGVGPADARGLCFEDYVQDTLQMIDALGAAPIVVGHSPGGLIAQRIAELGRARACVLLATAPAAKLAAQPVALPALLPMFPKILLGRPIRPSRAGCDRIALNRVAPADRARIYDALGYESGIVYREMIFGSVHVDASRVEVPVLVAGGAHDRVVSEQLSRFTATRYAAELVMYPAGGHWLFDEPGWERVADDVAVFIERVLSAGTERAPGDIARSA
jgi:pimeloyl-ACP methyl ester carboxylesterase